MKVTLQTYPVLTNHTDPANRLTLTALAGFMQEAALVNVKELGIPHTKLMEQNLAWVLVRHQIHCEKEIFHGDILEVKTWASGNDKYFFYRDFKVHNAEGEKVAEATSNWVLIDLKKRQVQTVPASLSNLHIAEEGLYPLSRAKNKLPLLKTPSHQISLTVGWHDLDLYYHTNNSIYFKWMLEPLPKVWLAEKKLNFFDISIKTESTYRQTLTSKIEILEHGKVLHLLSTEQGSEVVRAMSEWSD